MQRHIFTTVNWVLSLKLTAVPENWPVPNSSWRKLTGAWKEKIVFQLPTINLSGALAVSCRECNSFFANLIRRSKLAGLWLPLVQHGATCFFFQKHISKFGTALRWYHVLQPRINARYVLCYTRWAPTRYEWSSGIPTKGLKKWVTGVIISISGVMTPSEWNVKHTCVIDYQQNDHSVKRHHIDDAWGGSLGVAPSQ